MCACKVNNKWYKPREQQSTSRGEDRKATLKMKISILYLSEKLYVVHLLCDLWKQVGDWLWALGVSHTENYCSEAACMWQRIRFWSQQEDPLMQRLASIRFQGLQYYSQKEECTARGFNSSRLYSSHKQKVRSESPGQLQRFWHKSM